MKSFCLKNFKFPLFKGPLIETFELKSIIDKADSNLKVLDCTWSPDPINQKAKASFLEKRIKSAIFFDICDITDKSSKFLYMMPSEEIFKEKMREMNVRKDDVVVCYDQKGIFSSPRVWFSFKMFGAKNVYVLNGGLPKYLKDNCSLEFGKKVILI